MNARAENEPLEYKAETYIIAALANIISGMPADAVRNLVRDDDFSEIFLSSFGYNLKPEILISVIESMDVLGLIKLDNDKFVGRFISTQKTAFVSQFRSIAQDYPNSPMAISLRTGRPWIEAVFRQAEFWAELESDLLSDKGENLPVLVDDIPASDRTVTLLHNSPERKEIDEGMSTLSDAIRTNNEIASRLGDDRERLSAELEAARVGIKPERIRSGFIIDTVLKVLREIGSKLKDKATELGVERLMALFEALLETFF